MPKPRGPLPRRVGPNRPAADREPRPPGALSARIRDFPAPEELQALAAIDEDWSRTQEEIDAEIASGA